MLNIRSPNERRKVIVYNAFELSITVGREFGPLTMICAGVVVIIIITTPKTMIQRTSETIARITRCPQGGEEVVELVESFCPKEGAV